MNVGVRAWFENLEDDELFISVLVIGELRRGIERIRRRDLESADRLDIWLGRLTESYETRILPISPPIAERWGRLGVPDPVPVIDGLLAATALVHDLVLVTRKERDVRSTGVLVVNPFDERKT